MDADLDLLVEGWSGSGGLQGGRLVGEGGHGASSGGAGGR